MNQTELLCKIEQLRAVARQTPYIESVRESYGGMDIYYKPVTLNKAIVKGLYVRVSSDGAVDLRQDMSMTEVRHPHYSSPRLCSDGHYRLHEEFDAGRMENLLTEGLVYFNTVNQFSLTNTPPGVFDCAVCGEAIMDEGWMWSDRDKNMAHNSCMVTCSSCHNQFPRGEIKRRTWPLSGLRRETCDGCIERMQESAKATCVRCKEPVYDRSLNFDCAHCRRINYYMRLEDAGWAVDERGYPHHE